MADLYNFNFSFGITEQVKPGVKVTHIYHTDLQGFSVVGGIERHFWTDGRSGLAR